MDRTKKKKAFLVSSFRARIFLALVGISAAASLLIGLAFYYSAKGRLISIENNLLIQRSRAANEEATNFLENLHGSSNKRFPSPRSYAARMVHSVSDTTGLGVLYISPDGTPLAARSVSGATLDPGAVYRKLDLSNSLLQKAGKSSTRARILEHSHIAVWPLATGGEVRGTMIYEAPWDELNQTLSYLRYGIIGAVVASVLFAGGASLLLTRRITRPLSEARDAAIRFASGDYAPVPVERKDELGEMIRAFNYMAEEIKQYVGEIQGQKSLLEAVLEASPEAVIATDLEGRVKVANHVAASTLGVGKADSGRTLEELGAPAEILWCLGEASKNGAATREILFGERIYATYAARMGGEDPSNSSDIIFAARDITERRLLERTKTDFVSDVSHELRTPLTTIQSAADLIGGAGERLTPMEHRALELAQGELKRIREMVEELLSLAQMDSWQYSLEIGPADLGAIIRNSIDSVSTKAERFGIEIHFEERSEHRCVCDAQKLYQVFLNLLDNAIKYSDPGARVDVFIEEDDSSIIVQVRDTGVGIPEEDLSRLFERFYKVDKARSRTTGGTGLGLAISKKIVELHGGKISVESKVGDGSTFVVRLPRSPLPRSAT